MIDWILRIRPLSVGAELFLHHAEAVVGIHDRELRLQADVLRLLTHDLHAERVEGADRQLVDGHLAAFLAGRGERLAFEQLRRALAHFQRGLVREGERGDVLRLETLAFDQVRDFLRDHARLAAAGAGEHETGTVEIAHRFVLRGVQTCGHRVWTLRGVGRKDHATAGWTAKLGVIEALAISRSAMLTRINRPIAGVGSGPVRALGGALRSPNPGV